jgi:hypothetical protein
MLVSNVKRMGWLDEFSILPRPAQGSRPEVFLQGRPERRPMAEKAHRMSFLRLVRRSVPS